MKILVIVKQVIGEQATVVLRDNAIDPENTPLQTSSLDLVAIEQAVQLEELGLASRLAVCTVGAAAADKSLRTALAMGMGDATHIISGTALDALQYAKILQGYIMEQGFDLVLTGREDFDGGAGKTVSLLAGLMGWSQADFVTGLEVPDGGTVVACCQADYGQLGLSLSLPAVLGVDVGLNEPRYVKFPKLLKARKQPVDMRKVEEFGPAPAASLVTLGMQHRKQDRLRVRLESVADLAKVLKDKGFG